MEQRHPHVIKPTVGEGRPGNIIWFDTETRQTKQPDGSTRHTLRLGYAVYYRRFKRRGYVEQDSYVFADYDSFIEWISGHCRNKTTTYLVAHNIVFDLSIVHAYSELARHGWTLESFYSKATTSIFRWKRRDARLVGLDNMNLFAGKLEKWGRIFGYPKGHVDFDTVTDQDLLTYCKRDVEIMVRSWMEWLTFLDRYDLGSFKVTTASTAFSAWRHRFMSAKVFIHNDPDALLMERESYHGGRTECFWTGKRSDGPFYYLDVNNMYGYVLSRFEYPAGIWNVDSKPSVSRLLRKLEKQAVVARVLVDMREPVFPTLQDNITVYPLGQFITTLTTPELIYAIEQGSLLDVYQMAWYRRAPLFADYIAEFHKLRMDYRHAGNDGYEQIAKMLMNSLYGKFGQSAYDQRRIADTDPDAAWSQLVVNAQSGEVYRIFALGGGIYEEHKSGEAGNSFPGIAAHVTAYARLYLWQLIQIAGRKHVYYCDTDSMIVDPQGLENVKHLMDPDRLGYLKAEHESLILEIHAPKDYRMGERVKIKGVRDPSTITDQDTVQQDQWQRLGGQIQAGSTDDFLVKPVTKHLNRRIRSGVVGAGGWVRPFVLQADSALVVAARQKQLFEMLQAA